MNRLSGQKLLPFHLAFVPTLDLEPKYRHKSHNRGIASGKERGEKGNLAIY